MGNLRQILAGLAFFLLLATVFFRTNEKAENHSENSTEKVSDPSSKKISEVEKQKRNLAQTEETPPSHPRSQQIRELAKAPLVQPSQSELKEIEISDIKDNWKLWRNKRAVSPNELSNQESSQKSQGQNVGHFLLLDSAENNHRLNDFSLQEPWVVFNERLNSVGVLTGTISLHLQSPEQWKTIEEQFGLKLIHAFPEVGLYLVTSQKDRFDLQTTYEMLKSNPQVHKAELEIVSRQYVQ
jgi:hypothetical protein